jgi:hypothetical protein
VRDAGNGKRFGKSLPAGTEHTGEALEPQLGLFASEAGLLYKEIADLNLDAMTPLEAMNKLHELKKKVDGSN